MKNKDLKNQRFVCVEKKTQNNVFEKNAMNLSLKQRNTKKIAMPIIEVYEVTESEFHGFSLRLIINFTETTEIP